MAKYAVIQEDGEIQQVMESAVAPDELPAGAIRLPDDFSLGQDMSRLYVKGDELKLRPPRPSDSHRWDMTRERWVVDIARLRQEALRQVAAESDQARILPATQEAVYQRKREEADGKRPADLLAREAEARGISVEALVEQVRDASERWMAHASNVEVARVAAKQAIQAATSEAQIRQALTTFRQAVGGSEPTSA